jgi:hypothetical protein
LDQQLECQLLLSSLSETGAWNMAHMVAAEWERASDCQVFILVTNRIGRRGSRQLTQSGHGRRHGLADPAAGIGAYAAFAQPMVRSLEQAGVRICRSEFFQRSGPQKNRPAGQEIHP